MPVHPLVFPSLLCQLVYYIDVRLVDASPGGWTAAMQAQVVAAAKPFEARVKCYQREYLEEIIKGGSAVDLRSPG